MNAGGVPNTCKSSEKLFLDSFGMMEEVESGGRVSNAWATYLLQGDNILKRMLIPHIRLVSHDTGWKTEVVKDGPASD